MSSFLKGLFGKEDEEQGPEPASKLDVKTQEPPLIDDRGDGEDSEDGRDGDAGNQLAIQKDGDQVMKLDNKAKRQPVSSPAEPSGPRVFDIRAVWKHRAVTEEEQQRVKKAQDLLSALPPDIPGDAKRQIVEASLKAFEVSIDDIVAGASHEIEALQVYISTTKSDAESFNTNSKNRIAELESEIASIRKTMEAAEVENNGLVGAANAVIGEVTPILDFFEPTEAPKAKRSARMSKPASDAGKSEPGSKTDRDEDSSAGLTAAEREETAHRPPTLS